MGHDFLDRDKYGRFHPGVDLNGKGSCDEDLGLPIYAIADGIVKGFRDKKDAWGMMLSIYHPKYQVWSIYAHIQNPKVKIGDGVKEGQQIAEIGNSYGKYCAHLHFEIRKKATGSLTTYPTKEWTQDRVLSYYVNPLAFIESNSISGEMEIIKRLADENEALKEMNEVLMKKVENFKSKIVKFINNL